jgi:hypothetical protein
MIRANLIEALDLAGRPLRRRIAEDESPSELEKSAAGASASSVAFKSRAHLVSQITDHLEAGRHAEARRLCSELERLDGKGTPAPYDEDDAGDDPTEREGKTPRDFGLASGVGGAGGSRRARESADPWIKRLFAGERPLRESRVLTSGRTTIWAKKLL